MIRFVRLQTLLFLCATSLFAQAPPGAVTTVAGDGNAGFADQTPATTGRIDFAYGIAVDGAANVYIADCWNNRVRLFNSKSGALTTIAGSGVEGFPATAVRQPRRSYSVRAVWPSIQAAKSI